MKTIGSLPILLPLISGLLFSGCKKETTSRTAGEVVAIELQKTIDQSALKRVYAVRHDRPLPFLDAVAGTKWEFSKGFVVLNQNGSSQYHNLQYLVRYAVVNATLSNGTSEFVLILYMEQ